MPNKKFPLCKKASKYLFFQTLSRTRFSVLKIFQLCLYFQILTIYGVRAVFIFPLRLSPQYYIPGLVEPPPSKPYSINNALKYSHSSKSAQDVTNEFLRRFSQVSKKPRRPKKPSKPSKPNKPGKSPPSPYPSATQNAGIDFALPLNYEISNPSNQKPGSRQEGVEEKLVLIVFKLPVRQVQENGIRKVFSAKRRTKRQRPSLQFYERQDAEAAEGGAPSRTLSLGKKLRTWWEGGARPTSAYPKFRPTRPNRPFSSPGRPFTTTASSKFFFGKFLKNGSTQRPRPSRSPPTRGKTSPSTTKTPFMTFSDYTFNSPGCHPRGPKLILCSTDRIEHLSMLLEKFMHYQERNNLSPYFIDTEEEDSDSYGSYDNYPPSFRHYGYRPSGKIVGRSRKPYGVVESDSPGPHPSVVVLAMNNKDNEENHEEEEQQSNSHSHEGYHNNKDHEEHKDNGSEDETKDSVEMAVKAENDESTKSPRRKRNKRKLLRRVQRRSKEETETSSSSEEESFGKGSHREDALRDPYLSTKRKIEEERDAEYKRLKRLLKLIKRYQELV